MAIISSWLVYGISSSIPITSVASYFTIKHGDTNITSNVANWGSTYKATSEARYLEVHSVGKHDFNWPPKLNNVEMVRKVGPNGYYYSTSKPVSAWNSGWDSPWDLFLYAKPRVIETTYGPEETISLFEEVGNIYFDAPDLYVTQTERVKLGVAGHIRATGRKIYTNGLETGWEEVSRQRISEMVPTTWRRGTKPNEINIEGAVSFTGGENFSLKDEELLDLVTITVNGQEITADSTPIEPGQQVTIRVTKKDNDHIFKYGDSLPGTSNVYMPSVSDSSLSTHYPMAIDENGDLYLSKYWPADGLHVSISVKLSVPYPVEHLDIWGPPAYSPPGTNTFVIPYHENVFYFDRDERTILEPGTYPILKDIRVTSNLKYRYKVQDNKAQIYTLKTDHITYNFFVTGQANNIVAPKPIQNGYMVTVPNIDGVVYVDLITGKNVQGEYDLRYQPYKRMKIRTFPEYPSYIVVNTDEVWEFDINFEIRSVEPTRKRNVITIPKVVGAEYINKTTGQPVTGSVLITENTIIEAKTIGDYVFISDVNTWYFELVPKVSITADAVQVMDNWIIIPEVVGLEYFNTASNMVVSGTIYITQDTTIGSRTTDPNYYTVTNPDETWTLIYVAKPTKDIIIADRDKHLTMNIDGIQVTGPLATVELNTQVTINLGTKENGVFKTIPYLEDAQGTKQNFVKTSNSSAKLTITFTDNTPITLHAGSIELIYAPFYFSGYNAYAHVIGDDNKTQVVLPGQVANLKLGMNYKVEIYAEDGHEFDRNGTLTHNTWIIDIIPSKVVPKDIATAVTGPVRGPVYASMTAYYLYRDDYYTWFDEVTGELLPGRDPITGELLPGINPETGINPDTGVQYPIETTVGGYNNIYLVDKETLKELSFELMRKKRDFVYKSPGSLNYDSEIVTDPHNFIINVIELPFQLKSTLVTGRQRIVMGFTKLNVSAPITFADKVSINMGTIRIKPKYNNAYDYKNTTALLHLPYVQPMQLDVNYAMDQVISIEYLVDVYTGHTTINLRSSFTGFEVFQSTETFIGTEIPFLSMKTGTLLDGTGEIRSRLNNNVNIPYVEVIRNIPYEMDSKYNRDTMETVDNLRDIKGRIYVHSMTLDSAANTSEKALIEAILSGGITIR